MLRCVLFPVGYLFFSVYCGDSMCVCVWYMHVCGSECGRLEYDVKFSILSCFPLYLETRSLIELGARPTGKNCHSQIFFNSLNRT